MLYIDNNGNIKVNRGDTFEIPLFIDISDNIFTSTRYPFHDGDEIIFHVLRPNSPFEWPVLGKKFTYEDLNDNSDILVRFEHEDTVKLCPGTYYYEAKLITKWPDAEVEVDPESDLTEEELSKAYITIIPRRKFVLL